VQNHYVRAKSLLEAELGDEIVALDVEGGNCFGFNSVAAEIWRLLETPRDLESIQCELLDKFDVSPGACLADIQAHLAELRELGLVRTFLPLHPESAC
jgi:hypothetical protein